MGSQGVRAGTGHRTTSSWGQRGRPRNMNGNMKRIGSLQLPYVCSFVQQEMLVRPALALTGACSLRCMLEKCEVKASRGVT